MQLQAHSTRWPAALAAGVMAILLSATLVEAQTPEGRNFAGVEFLGRGIVYTANYERYVKRAGVGVGLAVWRIDRTVLIVPMYLSYRPIGHTHSLYLSAGATVGSDATAVFTDPKAVLGTASVGYEHLSKSGFVFRPTYNFLFSQGRGLLWPGFLIGYRF